MGLGRHADPRNDYRHRLWAGRLPHSGSPGCPGRFGRAAQYARGDVTYDHRFERSGRFRPHPFGSSSPGHCLPTRRFRRHGNGRRLRRAAILRPGVSRTCLPGSGRSHLLRPARYGYAPAYRHRFCGGQHPPRLLPDASYGARRSGPGQFAGHLGGSGGFALHPTASPGRRRGP